jgi:SAM-dependent methyltransferase
MMQVLQSRAQIEQARAQMVARGVSTLKAPLTARAKRFLQRFGLSSGPLVGDWIKSWDVLQTLEFIEQHLGKEKPVLDIGCYASEVLVALHRMGYHNLSGIDLNPNVGNMPHADSIRYSVGNFMQTSFADASFQAVTSISVVEHGLNGPVLMSEMARILRPGGYFISSFDYWPAKVNTSKTKFFGLDWLIFSKDDVAELLRDAAHHGLHPVGDLWFDAANKPVSASGYDYTFGWLVLEKRT